MIRLVDLLPSISRGGGSRRLTEGFFSLNRLEPLHQLRWSPSPGIPGEESGQS
jgi:hypothetical protein